MPHLAYGRLVRPSGSPLGTAPGNLRLLSLLRRPRRIAVMDPIVARPHHRTLSLSRISSPVLPTPDSTRMGSGSVRCLLLPVSTCFPLAHADPTISGDCTPKRRRTLYLQVHKPTSKHLGRWFYRCPIYRDEKKSCDFFLWAEDAQARVRALGLQPPPPTQPSSQDSTGTGGFPLNQHAITDRSGDREIVPRPVRSRPIPVVEQVDSAGALDADDLALSIRGLNIKAVGRNSYWFTTTC